MLAALGSDKSHREFFRRSGRRIDVGHPTGIRYYKVLTMRLESLRRVSISLIQCGSIEDEMLSISLQLRKSMINYLKSS